MLSVHKSRASATAGTSAKPVQRYTKVNKLKLYFSGLLTLLEKAVEHFADAQLYEAMEEVYEIAVPIYKQHVR